MKTIKQITDFECDHCQTKIKNCDAFPYEKGWAFLYRFEIKMPPEGKQKLTIDKHFCSKNCMIEYLTGVIRKEEE